MRVTRHQPDPPDFCVRQGDFAGRTRPGDGDGKGVVLLFFFWVYMLSFGVGGEGGWKAWL